jgi:CDP-L-myo-inositol myo-inositolphosphotransferase
MGSRLQSKAQSKPLLPLLGIPLIERVIRAAREAGADDFYVTIGYQGDRVRGFLENLAFRFSIPITAIVNDQWDSNENGTSILKARNYLSEPFLLLMGDHLFDPVIVCTLLESPLNGCEVALAVDGNQKNALVNLDDVTRVFYESGKILSIGKNITEYNGYDTGIFYCTPSIFEAIELSSKRGDTSLSAAVRHMASQSLVKAIDVSGQFWIDIDDPINIKQAEKAIKAQICVKPNDGPVSRYLNRPISIHLSRILINYPITPNQISLFSFVCSLVGAFLFSLGNYPALAAGGVLAQFASIIDGCDGEIARLTYRSSHYGGWFDAVLDRYADGFLLFGLTWHGYLLSKNKIYLLIGFIAIIGSFMVSYSADKYEHLMRERRHRSKLWYLHMGRDVRIFLVFIGALVNQIFLTLLLIAVLMNLEVLRRIIVYRDK